jgi:hypothetical protein
MHHAGAALHHTLHPRDPNPYFSQASLFGGYSSPSGTSPLRHLATQPITAARTGSPSNPQRAANVAAAAATLRSSSPAALVDGFAPFTGTSPSEFPYAQHLQERFLFTNTETHAATASCG